jgi:hypothetical protein
MRIKKIIGFMLVACAFVVALPAFAQTQDSQDAILEISSVSIPTDEFETGTTVEGSFVLTNLSNDRVEVYHRIGIVGDYEDEIPTSTYTMEIVGPISLKAHDSKTIKFKTSIPEGVTGDDMGIHIEAQTFDTAPVSADSKISITGSDRYLTVTDTQFLIDGEETQTVSNINRASNIIFNANLENETLSRFTITPHVNIYKNALIGKPFRTTNGSPTLFAPGDERVVGVEMPALEEGTYILHVTFLDEEGHERAPQYLSAYVVGEDLITIESLSASKTSAVAGDVIDVTLNYTVAPEAIGGENLNISVFLYNEMNEIVGSVNDLLTVDQATSTKIVSITATKPALGLRADVRVMRYNDTVSEFKSHISSNYDALVEEAIHKYPMGGTIPGISLAIIVATIILIVGAIAISVKKRRLGIMIVLGLVGAASLAFGLVPPTAQAAGLNTGYCGNQVNGVITDKNQLYSAMGAGKQHVIVSDPVFVTENGELKLKITITNKTDCRFTTSLGSFQMFDMYVYNQKVYDASPIVTIPKQNNNRPSVTTLTVKVPSTCSSQSDLFLNTGVPSNPGTASSQNAAYAAWLRNSSGEMFGFTKPAPYTLTTQNDGPNGSVRLINSKLSSSPFCSQKPTPPTNVRALASCGGVIDVSWNAPVVTNPADAIKGYHVYRNNVLVKTETNGSVTSFRDTNAEIGKGTFYTVDAFNAGGTSDRSSPSATVISKMCPPQAPTGIVVTPMACGSQTNQVKWTAVTGATSYSVERSTVLNGTYTTIPGANSLSSTKFDDKGLTPGTSYYYKVTAINSGGSKQSPNGVVGKAPNNCNLDADLQASPSSGSRPLNNVSLAVTNVRGSATGLITYKFDCTNDGTFEKQYGPTLEPTHIAANLCSYTTAANHVAAVTITRGGLSVKKTVTIPVTEPVVTFDYELRSSGDMAITAGGSGTNFISKELISGSPEPIDLVVTGLPGAASHTWNNNGTRTGINSVLSINTDATLEGTYTVVVTGTSRVSRLVRTTTFTLTVNAKPKPNVPVSCKPVNPGTGNDIFQSPVNRPVKWIATGPSDATYTWGGSFDAEGVDLKEYIIVYTTTGVKHTTISVDGSAPKPCDVENFNVSNLPDYGEF